MLEVIKVGGSLFSGTDFPPRLLFWLENRPRVDRILIAGGGESADLVRNWAARFGLSDGPSHWLAIQAMELQSGLASTLLGIPECLSFAECRREFESGRTTVLLRPASELRSPSAAPSLPESWDVTSDSIAAWVALRMQADALVLLKSVGDDRVVQLSEAVRASWVDPCFPALAPELTLWVDFSSGREWQCRVGR